MRENTSSSHRCSCTHEFCLRMFTACCMGNKARHRMMLQLIFRLILSSPLFVFIFAQNPGCLMFVRLKHILQHYGDPSSIMSVFFSLSKNHLTKFWWTFYSISSIVCENRRRYAANSFAAFPLFVSPSISPTFKVTKQCYMARFSSGNGIDMGKRQENNRMQVGLKWNE